MASKTLHEEHGVAVALNVGDLLIGEGYRLLATCQAKRRAKGGDARRSPPKASANSAAGKARSFAGRAIPVR